jgi:hypothetical protein
MPLQQSNLRIAYWYPDSTFSAWSIAQGAVNELRRMGHHVRSLGISPQAKNLDRTKFPSQEELCELDGIIVSGPEYLSPFIASLYPEWHNIKTPKAAWLHETVRREDYGLMNLDPVRRLSDVTFCPAIQDQEYGFGYLPFGVDTEMFRPEPKVDRDIPRCFIGMLYPKRRDFLKNLVPYMDGIEVQVGNVQIVEDGVVNQQKTVEAYASVLRRIKVFVNLPTLSQLLVTKVFEVAASGACLVTPRLKGVGERNQELLGDVIQLYDDASPAELAGLLRSLLNDDQERERLAQRACDEIHKRHGIRQRLQTILDSFSGHLGN